MTDDDGPKVWNGLAAAVSADRALLGPEACDMAARALRRLGRIDAPFSPQVRHVIEVLTLVANGDGHGLDAGSGPADVRSRPDPATSEAWIDMAAAARTLGCTPRHARRLALDGLLGPTRVLKRRRLVHPSQVEAYAVYRDQRRTA